MGWQGKIAARNGQGAGVVDGSIEGELNSFDQVEGDCVLEPTTS